MTAYDGVIRAVHVYQVLVHYESEALYTGLIYIWGGALCASLTLLYTP